MRRSLGLPATAVSLFLLAAATAGATATPPSKAEVTAMLHAVPATQKLCFSRNAKLSGTDPHFAVVVTQPACGASTYVHQWLKRGSLAPTARWSVVATRSGTIDHPAGCTTAAAVPHDIRCR